VLRLKSGSGRVWGKVGVEARTKKEGKECEVSGCVRSVRWLGWISTGLFDFPYLWTAVKRFKAYPCLPNWLWGIV
jgi:hypothetical protein